MALHHPKEDKARRLRQKRNKKARTRSKNKKRAK